MKLEKKLVFIFNPKAGKGKIKTSLMDIVDIFNKGGYEVIIRATQAPKDAYEQVKKYADKVDLIVCSGGDGTLDEVVTGITEVGSKVPVGYIPAGSTNDFARSIGLNGSSVEIARQIMTGSPRSIDIGSFNQLYFSYVASFGAFTETSYNTPQSLKNRLGHLAYLLEGVKDLSAIEPCHIKFVHEDTVMEDNYIWGAICNSTSIGGMIRLNKELVDFNDGLFEVMLIKMPKTVFDLTKIVVSINTQSYDPEVITFFQASELDIYPEAEIPWTLDGEYAPGSKEIHIRNMHNALQIIV